MNNVQKIICLKLCGAYKQQICSKQCAVKQSTELSNCCMIDRAESSVGFQPDHFSSVYYTYCRVLRTEACTGKHLSDLGHAMRVV